MHIPFYVKWGVLFPEESRTVKTSLVVTHFCVHVFKSLLHKLNFADHVCNFLLVCFNEVWLMPSFALLK